MRDDELARLAESWLIAMQAERLSVHTIESYLTSVRQYRAWCAAGGRRPDLADTDSVRGWLASLRAAGREGSTMATRLAGLRAFGAWLVEEGELADNGAGRAEMPHIDEKAPPALSRAEMDAIIAATRGKTFTEVRDEAVFSLLFDSLLRADELLSMRIRAADDTRDANLHARTVRVRRGKGGKERMAAFGAQTARRLDRYERTRARQPYAAQPWYWIGLGRGKLSYSGLYAALRRRGDRAGITVHPHMLRAGGAIEWRADGGSTEGLMTVAGWRDLKMVMRYTRAAEQQLALDEARRMHDKR